MKILTIIGARIQFIKAAMVSRALRQSCQEIILHTGQHYDSNMSQVFFEELGIPKPDVNLGVGSGTHAQQTADMMVGIEKSILAEKPDWVLVYGDTNSTLAGALAATKLHVKIAHVEAGLRSYNRKMPEEINRVLCDQISTALFCPTQVAVRNLEKEGVTQGVYEVGDVMADAVMYNMHIASQRSTVMNDLGLEKGTFALATVHRAGNTDIPERLESILKAFGDLDLPVVFPIHPRTKKIIQNLGIELADNVKLIEPVGYLDMLQLEANADCILTDSGGVQKEAYWAGTRCITLRDETEWVETVELGWNRLVGADRNEIVNAVRNWQPNNERPPVYGNGNAAEKICEILMKS